MIVGLDVMLDEGDGEVSVAKRGDVNQGSVE